MENNNQINQENSSTIQFGLPAKIFAQVNSYLFHPLFLPFYIILFLLYLHPTAFTGFSDATKVRVIFIVIINLLFFPLLSVLLLKAVGFIDSIFLKTQKDRIIPYIASGIFFFWAYHVFKEQSQYPEVWVSYLLGLFLASSAALIANIYFKVSMHAVGVGGWIAFFYLLSNSQDVMMTWPLVAVLLITGMVCTSRMILKAHDSVDIYGGLIIGVLTQLAGWYL